MQVPRKITWLVAPLSFVLCLSLGGSRAAFAAPAPVPAPILVAKAVLLTNGGVDQVVRKAFEHAGDPNLAYDDFYASMQKWGRYSLVSSPDQADLVIEISALAPLDIINTYAPGLTIRVYDEKSHFLLWSLAVPLDGAFRKATFEKNVQQAVDQGISDLKALASTARTP